MHRVYTPKRRTFIQVLPPANAYTKLFATCSCIFTYPFVGHSWYICNLTCMRTRICCLIAILRQNAYMHEQMTKEFEGRKYLYECTPFGYLNLCYWVSPRYGFPGGFCHSKHVRAYKTAIISDRSQYCIHSKISAYAYIQRIHENMHLFSTYAYFLKAKINLQPWVMCKYQRPFIVSTVHCGHLIVADTTISRLCI